MIIQSRDTFATIHFVSETGPDPPSVAGQVRTTNRQISHSKIELYLQPKMFTHFNERLGHTISMHYNLPAKPLLSSGIGYYCKRILVLVIVSCRHNDLAFDLVVFQRCPMDGPTDRRSHSNRPSAVFSLFFSCLQAGRASEWYVQPILLARQTYVLPTTMWKSDFHGNQVHKEWKESR